MSRFIAVLAEVESVSVFPTHKQRREPRIVSMPVGEILDREGRRDWSHDSLQFMILAFARQRNTTDVLHMQYILVKMTPD